MVNQLDSIRQNEMKLLFDYNINLGAVDTLTQLAPSVISIAVFGFYIALGHDLTPSTAFTVLSLLQLLNFPIT